MLPQVLMFDVDDVGRKIQSLADLADHVERHPGERSRNRNAACWKTPNSLRAGQSKNYDDNSEQSHSAEVCLRNQEQPAPGWPEILFFRLQCTGQRHQTLLRFSSRSDDVHWRRALEKTVSTPYAKDGLRKAAQQALDAGFLNHGLNIRPAVIPDFLQLRR